MENHTEETSGHPATPAAWGHEQSIAHSIGKSFASAHGHDHTGHELKSSAGPCGLSPMPQSDDLSVA